MTTPYLQFRSPVGIDARFGDAPSIASGAFDLQRSDTFTRTLDGTNGTLSLANDLTNQRFSVILKQDGTGSRTVTWWSGITWSGGATPTLATAANAIDVFTFLKTGTGAYLGAMTLTTATTAIGPWNPPSMSNAAAANNTVYYSTDASKLVYKDSSGTVNALY